MTVKELIIALQMQPEDAKVHMGYDGNIVTTQPEAVMLVKGDDSQIPDCWWRVHAGDVVILCDK